MIVHITDPGPKPVQIFCSWQLRSLAVEAGVVYHGRLLRLVGEGEPPGAKDGQVVVICSGSAQLRVIAVPGSILQLSPGSQIVNNSTQKETIA
ncbi:hypothetical protein KL932_000988 [Ogataea haglerorum]|uniref:Uncharacterized protein n=1 Tax=Ogataea haglerorum TaxID=1937702 RepID=A0ABQ7RK59_9ASCO|nr:hypothetical protein KL932_000988 [Ogataea haglerorum]KAG7767336.1 hypothetical protein KL946_001435 [Ogataea haglerorum]